MPYELEVYKRHPKTILAPPELKKIHPLGKSPVITDGDRTVAESAVILDYLATTYGEGKLRPREGSPEKLRYDYWLHYAEGSAMAPLMLKLVFEMVKRRAPLLARPVAAAIANKVLGDFVHPQMTHHFDYIESELAKSTWFAGEELTAADVQMSYPIEANQARGDKKSRPRTQAWLERIHARPAYKRAIERGGPVMLG